MPAGRPPIRPHPGKPFRTIADAARDGEWVVVRCKPCRHCQTFLAADLAAVIDPAYPIHVPPFPCSKCKSAEYIDVHTRSPQIGDVGRLMVRRPGAWIQKWRTVILGDP